MRHQAALLLAAHILEPVWRGATEEAALVRAFITAQGAVAQEGMLETGALVAAVVTLGLMVALALAAAVVVVAVEAIIIPAVQLGTLAALAAAALVFLAKDVAAQAVRQTQQDTPILLEEAEAHQAQAVTITAARRM